MAKGFTDEQLKAITTLDKSVLVSAAAGSGKTSVLIERIIRIILEGRANVDEMLVVTFTNAAASEMRLRLSAAIRKRMAEHPEDAARMRDQLARMYRAYISTIDSFALRVIREFFHEIDMEPNFTVADEVRCELLKREAVSELMEEGFANDSLIEGGSFREFLRLYSEERTEENFMSGLIGAYGALRTMPDYFEWAYNRAEQLRITPDTLEGSALQEAMRKDALDVFERVLDALRRIRVMFDNAGIPEMYESKLSAREAAVLNISERLGAGCFDAGVIALIDSIPSPRLVAKKTQKEAYETIRADVKNLNDALKEEIKNFKNRYLTPDFETRLSEMNKTCEYTVYYLRLLEEFEKRYDAKKRENRMIDFADMEHIAVRILRNNEAAETLRKRFRFIFVDEYQDTNNIQEHLISRVARPDNVFRVGDVKQSIYRFRQAEPEIFERLYERFSAGEDPDGEAVDLGWNFRSNDATIKYINHVFGRIMEGYDERAMLNTGLPCPEEYDFVPEVHILLEEMGSEESDNTEEAGETDDATEEKLDETLDEEIEEISKEEAEAAYIADLAASIIGTEFYDSKKGTVRKAGARDIVILLRAIKGRGEVMSRALRSRGIEPHIEESEDYFDTVEIEVALSLLMCIDNMKRDVPLISVLHSEIFGFGPEELAQIRIAHSEYMRGKDPSGRPFSAYWEAFEWYAENGPEGALRDKASNAKTSLLEWRMLSRMMPLEDFVWKVLVDSGYYKMAGAMTGGAVRQANLSALADRAGKLSRDSIANLSSFISFLEILKNRKLKNGQTAMAGSDDNVVRILTIHKSKGLEFPFVIVGSIGRKFKTDSSRKGFSFDSGVGIGLPYVDPARRYMRSTPVQRAIDSKSGRDAYKEELRLLYVAMTRARNKLFLVGTCKNEEELAKCPLRPASYMKAMSGVLDSCFNKLYISPLVLTGQAAEDGRGARMAASLDRPLSTEEQAIYDEIDRRFRYRYPDEDLLTAKAKWSVSAIRREELEEERAKQREVVVMSGDEVDNIRTGVEKRKRASSADIGTAYHRVMEFLDFAKAAGRDGKTDIEYIKERAEFLRDHGAIYDDVYASLDLNRIAAFFDSDLGRRATAAGRRGSLRREKPFTLKTVRNNKEMVVQGVIDCCFEEDGRMILVDYKSSYIKPGAARAAELERIRDEYKIQIELYSEAIEKGTGMEVGEAYLYLFTIAEAVRM